MAVKVKAGRDKAKYRTGKGFSLKEIEAAELSLKQARELKDDSGKNFKIDERRKSKHQINVDFLKKCKK